MLRVFQCLIGLLLYAASANAQHFSSVEECRSYVDDLGNQIASAHREMHMCMRQKPVIGEAMRCSYGFGSPKLTLQTVAWAQCEDRACELSRERSETNQQCNLMMRELSEKTNKLLSSRNSKLATEVAANFDVGERNFDSRFRSFSNMEKESGNLILGRQNPKVLLLGSYYNKKVAEKAGAAESALDSFAFASRIKNAIDGDSFPDLLGEIRTLAPKPRSVIDSGLRALFPSFNNARPLANSDASRLFDFIQNGSGSFFSRNPITNAIQGEILSSIRDIVIDLESFQNEYLTTVENLSRPDARETAYRSYTGDMATVIRRAPDPNSYANSSSDDAGDALRAFGSILGAFGSAMQSAQPSYRTPSSSGASRFGTEAPRRGRERSEIAPAR